MNPDVLSYRTVTYVICYGSKKYGNSSFCTVVEHTYIHIRIHSQIHHLHKSDWMLKHLFINRNLIGLLNNKE